MVTAAPLSCSHCYAPIDEGAEVVILTRNHPLDFNDGWAGVIVHKACALKMDWRTK